MDGALRISSRISSIAFCFSGSTAGGFQGESTATGVPRRVMTISWPAAASASSEEKAWLASRADTVRKARYSM